MALLLEWRPLFMLHQRIFFFTNERISKLNSLLVIHNNHSIPIWTVQPKFRNLRGKLLQLDSFSNEMVHSFERLLECCRKKIGKNLQMYSVCLEIGQILFFFQRASSDPSNLWMVSLSIVSKDLHNNLDQSFKGCTTKQFTI